MCPPLQVTVLSQHLPLVVHWSGSSQQSPGPSGAGQRVTAQLGQHPPSTHFLPAAQHSLPLPQGGSPSGQQSPPLDRRCPGQQSFRERHEPSGQHCSPAEQGLQVFVRESHF